MDRTIDINGNSYDRVVYRDEPVLTLRMIEDMHNRSRESVHINFTRNKDRFREGKDYFSVPHEEWKTLFNASKDQLGVNKMLTPSCKDNLSNTEDGRGWPKDENQPSPIKGGHRGPMIFLTQLGYLKLIKTFNDDLAWDIYIQVVEHYFLTRVAMGSRRQPNPEYVGWLKEQRMSMGEERRFQEFALAEADRLLRTEGSVTDLAHVPLLQDAVAAVMRTDPRYKQKQLDLFED